MPITTVQFVCVIIPIMLYTRSVKSHVQSMNKYITRVIRVVDNPKEISLHASFQQLQFVFQWFWSLVFPTAL